MVTYDGAPGELMVGIKEEHHELIGVVVSSYLQKSFVWQCLERCLGVSMNTVGWSKEEHQYTGMDGPSIFMSQPPRHSQDDQVEQEGRAFKG